MKQSDVFRAGEGDAWYERNKDKLGKDHDPVIELMKKYITFHPSLVFEIGCANGCRLRRIEKFWTCPVMGVDPSWKAINEGALVLGISGRSGTAENLEWVDANSVDVLIYGFCLYLCDPEDYFKIVAEGDRVLKDGGYLIIHDFDARSRPKRVPYDHKVGVFSHHVEFEYLWSGHPWYQILEQKIRGEESFIIMKKDSTEAWK